MDLLMFLRHSLQQFAGGLVGRLQQETFPQRVLRLRRLTQAIKRLSQIVEGFRFSGVESNSLIQISDGGPVLPRVIIEDAQKEIALRAIRCYFDVLFKVPAGRLLVSGVIFRAPAFERRQGFLRRVLQHGR